MCYPAPNITEALFHRINSTTFGITVIVKYTGGGPSATLEFNTTCSDLLGNERLFLADPIELVRNATDKMKWHAVLMDPRLASFTKVQFNYRITNNIIQDGATGKAAGRIGEYGLCMIDFDDPLPLPILFISSATRATCDTELECSRHIPAHSHTPVQRGNQPFHESPYHYLCHRPSHPCLE